MDRVMIVAADGNAYIGSDGRRMFTMGDYTPRIGDWVYADGPRIYGHTSGVTTPAMITLPDGVVPFCTYSDFGYFDTNGKPNFVEWENIYGWNGIANAGGRLYGSIYGEEDGIADLATLGMIGPDVTYADMEVNTTGQVLSATYGAYTYMHKTVTAKNYYMLHQWDNKAWTRYFYSGSNETGWTLIPSRTDILEQDYFEENDITVLGYHDIIFNSYYDTDYEYNRPMQMYRQGAEYEHFDLSSLKDTITQAANDYIKSLNLDETSTDLYPSTRREVPDRFISSISIGTQSVKLHRDGTYEALIDANITVFAFPRIEYTTSVYWLYLLQQNYLYGFAGDYVVENYTFNEYQKKVKSYVCLRIACNQMYKIDSSGNISVVQDTGSAEFMYCRLMGTLSTEPKEETMKLLGANVLYRTFGDYTFQAHVEASNGMVSPWAHTIDESKPTTVYRNAIILGTATPWYMYYENRGGVYGWGYKEYDLAVKEWDLYRQHECVSAIAEPTDIFCPFDYLAQDDYRIWYQKDSMTVRNGKKTICTLDDVTYANCAVCKLKRSYLVCFRGERLWYVALDDGTVTESRDVVPLGYRLRSYKNLKSLLAVINKSKETSGNNTG